MSRDLEIEAATAAVLAVNATDGKGLTHAMARRRAVAALDSVSVGGDPPQPSEEAVQLRRALADLYFMVINGVPCDPMTGKVCKECERIYAAATAALDGPVPPAGNKEE